MTKGKHTRGYTAAELRAGKAGKDETDMARLRAMTDEEIERAGAEDEDSAAVLTGDWLARTVALRVVRKKPVTMRLDEDVLAFYRDFGRLYQRRMNAVLRAGMNAMRRVRKTHAGK